MPIVDHFRVEWNRLPRVKPTVTRLDTEDMADAVEVPKPNNELSDDGVETGAEAAASDDGGAHVRGVEEDLLSRSGAVVGEVQRGRGRELAGEVEDDAAEDDVGV